MVREGVVLEGARADLAVAAALPAARAAEVAVLPEAVRPEDVRGVPPAAVNESKQSKAEWRGLPALGDRAFFLLSIYPTSRVLRR